MARIARVVAAGLPHHITQRGNRRQQTFFSEADYIEYISLLAEWCKRCDVLAGNDDELIKVSPLLETAGDWQSFLSEEITDKEVNALRQHERNGRPLGSEHFVVEMVEGKLGRTFSLQKPGPNKNG